MEGLSEVLTGALSTDAAAFTASVLLRGLVLVALAAVVAAALGRRSAATRHHVWVLAMAGLLAIPLLTYSLPDWEVGLPVPFEGVGTLIAGDAGNAAVDAGPISPAADVREAPAPLPVPDAASGPAGRRATSDAGETQGLAGTAGSAVALSWPAALFALWLGGCLVLLVRLIVGLGGAARLARTAVPVGDRRWTVLVSSLCLRAGLCRHVRVVSSPKVSVPMTWGIFGRWLILPEGIGSWPEERRRVVVLHELAHLKRRDCLVQALSDLALALHWPNPLAWIAARRIRSERERACDDAVLVAGTNGQAYAHHLVEVARGLTRGPPRPARAAVAMARHSELEGRVLAILDEDRGRNGLGRRAARTVAVGFALLMVPLTAFEPVPGIESAPAAGVDPGDLPPARVVEAAAGPVEIPSGRVADAAAIGVEPLQDSNADTLEADKNGGVAGNGEATKNSGAADDGEVADSGDTKEVVETDDGVAMGRSVADGKGVADGDGLAMAGAGTMAYGTAEAGAHIGRDRVTQEAVHDTIEERVFTVLTRALASEDVNLRRQAAHTLGMMEKARGVGLLAGALSTEADGGVRREAAWALGMIESPEGVAPLVPLLGDESPEVREQAIWALGMIEAPEGAAPLVPLLSDESPEIRDQAAWALGMIESSAATEGLVAAFASEPEPEVRAQIIWALGMIEDRAAAGTIIDAIEDSDPEVRDKAFWALGMVLK